MNARNFALLALTTLSVSPAFSQTPGVDFFEKFKRQERLPSERATEAVFSVGEVIQAPVFVFVEGEEARFLVDVSDIRHSDSFVVSLKGDGLAKARSLMGIPSEVTVRIAGQGHYEVSNMFKYPVELLTLKARVGTNPKSFSDLTEGAPVSLRGVVTSQGEISVKKPWGDEKIPVFVLKLTDDREVTVQLITGLPDVTQNLDPHLENSERTKIQMGDEVLVQAFSNGTGGLAAHWCRSFWLVKASAARQAAYDALHATHQGHLGSARVSLEKKDFKGMREHIAAVVKTEPTKSEWAEIESLNGEAPAQERVIVFRDRYSINSLNRTFEVDFDTMTQAQFLEFMESYIAFRAPIRVLPEKETTDETYLHRVFEEAKIDRPMQIDLVKRIIDAHLDRFQALLAADKLETGWVWRNEYSLDQWTNILSYEKSAMALTPWARQRLDQVGKLRASFSSEKMRMQRFAMESLERHFTDAIQRWAR